MSFRTTAVLAVLVASAALVPPASAGIVVYEEGNKKVEVGARLQLQYHRVEPDDGESSDELFFRRLRPEITGTVTENWSGKFQIDFGKSDVAIKDAFMEYTGFEWGTITIGNAKPFFSREFLTSSKKQELVERTFTGDHNYGSLDRALGFHFSGEAAEGVLGWGASAGSASHDPDVKKMDFDTPVNRDDDFNDGWYASGRLDWFPLGPHPFDQTDFDRGPFKFSLSTAAYTWSNDNDNDTFTSGGSSTSTSKADLESATGFEVSAGLRGRGFSADVEAQRITGELVDGALTAGLYRNGETDLDVFSLEGGYLLGQSVEAVAGYELLDATNYGDEWTRLSAGLNYYWNEEKAKVQLTYRMNQSVDGVSGRDTDETFLQFQFAF